MAKDEEYLNEAKVKGEENMANFFQNQSGTSLIFHETISNSAKINAIICKLRENIWLSHEHCKEKNLQTSPRLAVL